MRILCTGATGSFGNAFVRRALEWDDCEWLAVYSRSEEKQQTMSERIGRVPGDRLRFFLGDVRDRDRLEMAMRTATVVVHAAALKVVPWLEYNPSEGVRTNVGGATNVVDVALRCGVEKVIGLSTDKAAAPVNLYGATKLAAEKLFLAANALGETRFTVCRYGNVSGSTGSVIPKWREHLAKHGPAKPLRVTDDRMTRYWMTLGDAVDTVESALRNGRGREVWVPKLPSYNIVDLAHAVWRDSLPDVALECYKRVTGIRPGEKLHESLVGGDEAAWAYDCGDHYEIVHPRAPNGPGGRTEQIEPRGTKVPDGFRYRSDENEQWLTTTELRERLKAV